MNFRIDSAPAMTARLLPNANNDAGPSSCWYQIKFPVISAEIAAHAHKGHFTIGEAKAAASKIPAGNQIEMLVPGMVHKSSVIAAAIRQTA